MKFIADAMLGRLAKRLRLLGSDVLYAPDMTDNELLRLALEQGRIILTRDTGLASRPLARNHLFIASDRVDDQVQQVTAAFSLAPETALTRCSVCNVPLETLGTESARDRVPELVLRQRKPLMHCRKCGRIFWRGSHVRNMQRFGALK